MLNTQVAELRENIISYETAAEVLYARAEEDLDHAIAALTRETQQTPQLDQGSDSYLFWKYSTHKSTLALTKLKMYLFVSMYLQMDFLLKLNLILKFPKFHLRRTKFKQSGLMNSKILKIFACGAKN